MEFNPNNNIIKLCIQGMDMEGEGKPEAASRLFLQAWNEATNDFEKFIAAHYVARHQKNVSDKLRWLRQKIPGQSDTLISHSVTIENRRRSNRLG